MAERLNWESKALCAALIRAGEADPDLWFPPTKGRKHEGTARAINICRECPVWRECRTHADDNDLQGVWGGIVFVRDRTHRRVSGRISP